MKLKNWNGNPTVLDAEQINYADIEALPTEGCLRGNGRSYGDASLDRQVISMLSCREILRLENGVLHVSGGFTLEEVLNFIVPQGFLFPCIPGTKSVTIGGMIAADAHGKNHEKNGAIGHWIQTLELKLPNGEVLQCNADLHPSLFRATIGGLGLTGMILSAEMKLEKNLGTSMLQRTTICTSMEHLLNALNASSSEYQVAWFNARKSSEFFLLENDPIIEKTIQSFRLRKAKMQVPKLPFSLVNEWMMEIYNRRYARTLKRQIGKPQSLSFEACFFPLDRIGNWNRLYGPRGFYQLQCCFSLDRALAGVDALLQLCREAQLFPVLSVVKKHGKHPQAGLLSFTVPGISFAFDFINRRGTKELLEALNKKVAEFGGRVYLVKDALLDVATFEQMYPEVESFRNEVSKVNQGQLSSLMAKRLNLLSK